jgi:hypothetical protein
MSSYYTKVKIKKTGEIVDVLAIDDYFSRHEYGYKIADTVYHEYEVEFLEDTIDKVSSKKAKIKIKDIQELVDFHYDKMFHWLCNHNDDDLYELKITVKTSDDGLTINRSWRDRDKRLTEDSEV